ncbi:cell division control protein 45 homolog [Anopheles arabiensis]|uniref:AGAP011961-PA n=2 Tax=gambiae species complex TaxID=44542 RepID=Q7PZK7_ANOGA|nr:cell division control protein 45 homolog [Anopheles arabiensis]EAA00243.1 AGAP011961-PA [Anopheles gambiae str. PEST]
MFIADLRKDFYQQLIGKRILVLVNYDLDAICASKILQALFRCDNVIYSIVPIMGLAAMRRAYSEHRGDIRYVLLVNCGGCIDIVDVLQPDQDVVFFICDSHRPYDVCNVYSDGQVRILGEMNRNENIPAFEDIFQDSDNESGDEDEEDVDDAGYNEDGGGSDSDGGGGAPKPANNRIQRIEQRLLRRRERKAWQERRLTLMFEYAQYAYYGSSSALSIFELAWRMSKDSLDLLWWAIVGVTEQKLLGKVESASYTLLIEKLQSHVSRLTNKASDQAIQTSVKIVFESDLQLALFRHWSVLDSLRYSYYPACRLKLWTHKGDKQMNELLVDMGLPLVQAKQTFNAMDLVLRREFYEKIEKFAEKYNMPDVTYASFVLQYGYRNKYSAADYVYSMLAILESVRQDRLPEACFLQSMDALSRGKKAILDEGIDLCKTLLTTIFKQVQTCLEMHQIRSAGPFLYLVLQEEVSFFSCPYGLLLLARFLLRAHVAVSRNRRAQELPLIAVAPIDLARGISLLAGVPPVCEDSRHFFAKAFEEAGNRSGAVISQDFFETAVIQIKQSDCTKFLDALTVMLS